MSASVWMLDSVQTALWRLAPRNAEGAQELAREAGIPQIIAALLIARGARTAAEVARFFSPDVSQLHDPLALRGAEEAADLLVRTARAGRRIVVFGDYDVDGVTSVAQLRAALLRAGSDAVAFLPHRLRDGYGLKPKTVRAVLRDLHPAVLITVDCGITAVEGVACARAAGVEVVVTDHHLVPEALPAGAVVVNPRQPGCGYPEKELAACGIALKIAQAVARRAGIRLSLESLLRAACLGTIADLVPLAGENRAIAAAGLSALANARAPGIKALLAECGVEKGQAPTSEQVAFRIAPRLNAAGRLDTAELALSVFEEREPVRAAAAARELSRRNAERQAIEREVTARAREKLRDAFDSEKDAVILLAEEGWHRGVLGIAASRLAREYHRPVLLFALEGERATGSGRSVPGVPLHGILKEAASLFDEFGGHDQAVGASLARSRLPELAESARALFGARAPRESLVRVETAEAELALGQADEPLLDWLERLEPHGMGNPRPVFAASAVRAVAPPRLLGEVGLRGRLRDGGGFLECICWERGSIEALWRDGAPLDIQFRLRRGLDGAPEGEIVAARPAAMPAGQALAATTVRQ